MKMNTQSLFIVLALIAGALVPLQTASNASLSRSLHSGLFATLVVFVVAAVTIAFLLVAKQEPLPAVTQLKEISVMSWIAGGILGAVYIFLLIYLSPKLGIAAVTGFVVAGQLLMAVAIDHFGWLGFPVHTIQWQRIIGILLLGAGLYLIKKF